jgi:hypothetical protein
MFYQDIEKLTSSQFKRLTGVKREVFEQMLAVLNEVKTSTGKHPSRGTPAKLSNADKLLLLLMYYREIAPSSILAFHMAYQRVVSVRLSGRQKVF